MFNVTNLDTWYIFEIQNMLLTNWIDEIGWIWFCVPPSSIRISNILI